MAKEYRAKESVLLVASYPAKIKITAWAVISASEKAGNKKAFRVTHVKMVNHRGDEKIKSHVMMDNHRGDEEKIK